MKSERPFYWIAPPQEQGCYVAPTGWYQLTESGLKYIGPSILLEGHEVAHVLHVSEIGSLTEEQIKEIKESPEITNGPISIVYTLHRCSECGHIAQVSNDCNSWACGECGRIQVVSNG